MSNTYNATLVEVTKKFPKFKLVKKSDSLLMKIFNIFFLIFSFGSNKVFMTHVTTTIGYTVYIPSRWLSMSAFSRVEILNHEAVHMTQRKKIGFLFFFLYLLFPLPIFFAYYRTKFEKEAYAESLRQMVKYYGIEVLDDPKLKSSMVSHFTSGQYLWMWILKSSIETWFDQTVQSLKDNFVEEDQEPTPPSMLAP